MSINPHYVPGMGYKKHQPIPKRHDALDEVITRVRCGEIELKLTLTAKLLAKSLRAALVEPFLKVHNKRAATPVEWDQIVCIKVGCVPLASFDGEEVTAAAVLTPEALKQKARYRDTVSVVLMTAIPRPLLAGFTAVARELTLSHDDPPKVTQELLQIAADAATSEESDADMARRCVNAFQKIGDGADAVSVAAVRLAFLTDEYVRSLSFPEVSPHMTAIEGALERMATSSEASVELSEFSAFLTGISAAACAIPSAGIEPVVHTETLGHKNTGNSFLDQILNDDSVTARRVA
eukprot:CAMPEP_0174702154 /NCGR_PEP_ID=MMETSP1094-20130205/6534_1 /TAXON_ID=156173 /ORGANISM="Chrysochromulina brevifilum, Strain UTEX LB 985" /LENGTH=292 /DNA_ID=CAMNT_0015899893 /DNA_START=129 /DNA_END=1007 /DNA_ORIENTATION=+